MISPDVEGNSARSGDRANHSEVRGRFLGENAGLLETVFYGRRVQGLLGDSEKVFSGNADRFVKLPDVRGPNLPTYSAGESDATPVSRADCLRGSLKQILLDPRTIGRRNAEADIAAKRTEVAYVSQESLHFKSYESYSVGLGRDLGRKELLDRMAIGNGMGKAVVAGDRFSQTNSLSRHHVLEQTFSALMRIKELELKVEDSVPDNAKTKMPGLNNPGVHGADRHLTYTLALYFEKLRVLLYLAVNLHECPATRNAGVVQERRQGWMAGEFNVVTVVDLSLVPGGRRGYGSQRTNRTCYRVFKIVVAAARQVYEVMHDHSAACVVAENGNQPPREPLVGTEQPQGFVPCAVQI
jgi:hypothetical protein